MDSNRVCIDKMLILRVPNFVGQIYWRDDIGSTSRYILLKSSKFTTSKGHRLGLKICKKNVFFNDYIVPCTYNVNWLWIFACGGCTPSDRKIVTEEVLYLPMTVFQGWILPFPGGKTENICQGMLHLFIFLDSSLQMRLPNAWKIVAAFRGMHVSPAKHSYMYAWLPRKCDRRTDRRTDGQTTDKS